MKILLITGLLTAAALLNAQDRTGRTLKLENDKVKVSEIVYEPGVPRERFTRPTDQVIVFLEDCRYQRIDSGTGEKTVRERKAGETIWHNKGEDAPVLINLGKKPYRTLLIEMKK